MPVPKCLSCGQELVKPEDFASGDISKDLCAQCSHMRVSQHRPKPWQDTRFHRRFGHPKPPSEKEVHEAYKQKLREEGKTAEEIKELLRQWHEERAA